MKQQKEKFGIETKQLAILKKKEKFIKPSLLKRYQKTKMYQFIFMENGMIYVEARISLPQVKSENILNLQKYQEHIGEETLIMKCCNEYMVRVGQLKKI